MPQVSGFEYIKSWPGLLKIGEFFSLLIAFACLADFADKSETNGSFKFFLFVTITAWLATMLFLGLFISGTSDRISINWTLTLLIYSTLYAFFLLISASLVAEKARQFRRGVKTHKVGKHPEFEDTCDYYKDSPCRNVEAAAAFAFIALAMFVADTTLYFMEYRAVKEATIDNSGFVQHDETGTQSDQHRPDVEQIP